MQYIDLIIMADQKGASHELPVRFVSSEKASPKASFVSVAIVFNKRFLNPGTGVGAGHLLVLLLHSLKTNLGTVPHHLQRRGRRPFQSRKLEGKARIGRATLKSLMRT